MSEETTQTSLINPQTATESSDTSVNTEATTEAADVSSTPELLMGKYKDVDALINGKKESDRYVQQLQQELKTTKEAVVTAPEEYVFDFEDKEGFEDVELNMEDPELAAMLPVFKEAGLSQEQADSIVGQYVKNLQDAAPDIDEEYSKLGDNANTIVSKLEQFAEGLNEKDQNILAALADTAAGTEFLYRHLVGSEANIPAATAAGPIKSSQELIDDAQEYRRKNSDTIGSSSEQQKIYNTLMQKGLALQEKGR